MKMRYQLSVMRHAQFSLGYLDQHLNSRLADPYQLPEYSRGHFQTKQREHIALLF